MNDQSIPVRDLMKPMYIYSSQNIAEPGLDKIEP